MITEQQQEQAALCALGTLDAEEQRRFAAEVRANPELRELLLSLQQALDRVALAGPAASPPTALKAKVLARIQRRGETQAQPCQGRSAAAPMGLRFLAGSETTGW